MRRPLVLMLGLTAACGSSAPADPSCTTDCPTVAAFDACGGKIVRADGSIDADEYRAQATAWSAEVADCRLGPGYQAFHPGGTGSGRPTAWGPPTKINPYGANGQGMPYQLAGPPTQDPGGYGTVDDQVLYVPDDPANPGLDRIITYMWGGNAINEAPIPTWWGTPECWWPGCASHPDPLGQNQALAAAMGHPVREPMFMRRTTRSWDNDVLVVFKGGFIAATGTETSASSYAFIQLPPEKVPTALAITNESEFALVTVWDTQTLKGQVAVIALESAGLVHNWFYMGYPSVGSFSRMKLLGYVDLPDMATPTAIDVSASNGAGAWPGGLVLGQHTLETPEGRAEFTPPDGPLSGAIATDGYAIVASRWEGKVAFLDLRPLYSYMNQMYLGSQASFDETQASAGPAPDQWPYAFSVVPQAAPVYVKTLSGLDHPQAVLAGSHRAYVASFDGTIRLIDASAFGLEPEGDPATVVVTRTFQVGPNPIQMIWLRDGDPLSEHASPYVFDPALAVVSRGDAAIDWLDTDAEPVIFRHFTDSRMQDPVAIDIGERAYVLSVADFHGKKVLSYRFAPTPAEHTSPAPPRQIGMGPTGNDAVELGGEMSFEGVVVQLSSTNVN